MFHTDEKAHNRNQRHLPGATTHHQTARHQTARHQTARHQAATEPAWVHELAQGLDALRHAHFLPNEPLRVAGWHAESEYRPALDVGGDFYAIIPLPDARFGVLFGDVAGKGEPAARVMAAVRAVLHAEAQTGLAPAQVLRNANEVITAILPAGIFVTCFYMVVDAYTGSARFANAGHNPPLKLYGDTLQRLDATGFPLGLLPDVVYNEADAWLEQGSTLVLYSDGITEAHNHAREMFGFARIHEVAAMSGRQQLPKANTGQTPISQAGNALMHILRELEVFTGATCEQEDDITLLVLHRL